MILLRYAIVFIAVALGTALLVRALNTHADGVLGSSAQLMVPAMIAAALEGQQSARANRARAATGVIWSFTWLATLVATVLNVAIAYLAGSIAPEFGKLAIAPFGGQQFLILLGLYAGGYLICNRLFFGIGQSNQLSLMRSRGEIE
jgi:hypothetical protein